jgi:hypothetical protein
MNVNNDCIPFIVSKYVYFKLIFNDSIKIFIPYYIKINELNNYIKKQIKRNYDISTFDIIEGGTPYGECNSPIDENNNNFYSKYKNSAFYIKPKKISELNPNKIKNINEIINNLQTQNICNYECKICFNIKNINEFRILTCTHNMFCNTCINIWLENNSSCPFCRTSI